MGASISPRSHIDSHRHLPRNFASHEARTWHLIGVTKNPRASAAHAQDSRRAWSVGLAAWSLLHSPSTASKTSRLTRLVQPTTTRTSMGSPLLPRLRLNIDSSRTRRRASNPLPSVASATQSPPASSSSPSTSSSSWKAMFRSSGSKRFQQQRNRSHGEKLEVAPAIAASLPPPASRRAARGKMVAPWRRHSTGEPPVTLPVAKTCPSGESHHEAGDDEELRIERKKRMQLLTNAVHLELARMLLLV